MKYQISIILSILASLTFGCEVTHPVDPAFDNCRQAGGTWKDSKCICPPDIAASTNQTVCRDGKIYTCSNGLLNLVTQCPGECSDNGKLCNLETGGDGDVCYSDKDKQTSLGYLYSCENGKCKLKTICPLGCNDEEGHENECKKCEDKSVMCQGEYLKTCINGYWDSGVKCLNGCDKEQKICSSKEGYSSEKTKCDGDYLEIYYVYQNDQLELKERKYCDNGCSVDNGVAECISCEPNKLACDGNVLKICNENNVWVDKETCPWECSDGACTCETNQTKCENKTLYICNDGQWEKLEDCGEKGCKDNNSCHSSTSNNYDVVCSDGELTCIDMELKICEQGQWQLKEKCNDDSGTDMGFCYIDQCIKCEQITGIECIGNMQSQIMCQTSEGKIPTQIDCAFGCTSNNNGYCEPCSESMPQKCESNKEYQCFNGMWQYTKTCALGCNDDNTACNEPTSSTQTCDPKVDNSKKCDMNNTAVVKCINGQWEPIENCGDNGCVNGMCGECMAGQKTCSSDGRYLNICTGSPAKYETIECTKGCEDGVCIDSCQTKSISCSFELGSPIFKTCNDGNVSQFICDKCQSDLLCDTIKSAVDCSNNLPTNIECDENNNIKCIGNKLGCIMDNQTKAITICKDQTISINAEYPNTYVGWYDLYEQYAPDEITDLNNVFLDNIFELNELTSVNKLNMCKNNQKAYSITRINENSSYNREDRLSDYIFCIDDACDNCINLNIDTMIIERVCSVGIDTHWGNLSNYK